MRNRLSIAVTVLVLFIGIVGLFRGHQRRNTLAVETGFDIRRTELDGGDSLELRQENDETPRRDGGSRTDATALGNRDGDRATIDDRSTTSSPGGIVENARVVYKQISTEILVSV